MNATVDPTAVSRLQMAWLSNPITFSLNLSVRQSANGLAVTGFVPNASVKKVALNVAMSAGVGNIEDHIQVHPGMPIRIPQNLDKNVLKANIIEALEETNPGISETVRVYTSSTGKVTLSGSVSSTAEAIALCQALRGVDGCSSLTNRMRTTMSSAPIRTTYPIVKRTPNSQSVYPSATTPVPVVKAPELMPVQKTFSPKPVNVVTNSTSRKIPRQTVEPPVMHMAPPIVNIDNPYGHPTKNSKTTARKSPTLPKKVDTPSVPNLTSVPVIARNPGLQKPWKNSPSKRSNPVEVVNAGASDNTVPLPKWDHKAPKKLNLGSARPVVEVKSTKVTTTRPAKSAIWKVDTVVQTTNAEPKKRVLGKPRKSTARVVVWETQLQPTKSVKPVIHQTVSEQIETPVTGKPVASTGKSGMSLEEARTTIIRSSNGKVSDVRFQRLPNGATQVTVFASNVQQVDQGSVAQILFETNVRFNLEFQQTQPDQR